FHNLIEDDFPIGFDVILCRNVVIYFNLETTIRIMSKVRRSLSDAGYLFIGYSESLQFMADEFRMIDHQDAIYYGKAGERPVSVSATAPTEPEPVPDLDKIIEELSRSEIKADAAPGVKRGADAHRMRDISIEIVKRMHLKRYDGALSLVDEAIARDRNNTDPYYLAAEICMNQGRLKDAEMWLSNVVNINPLDPPAHYLFGCIYMGEERLDEAKASLKKALYLDRDLSLAHFYLANIYRTEGKTDSAIREYRSALNGLSKSRLDDILAHGGGFNAATLASVCRDNLERLKALQ
ncbi:MAG: hypothetical protein EHM32_02125, partial [Spirochaetales bacterium]